MTQTATILGTLIEKVGLRIPTSFVYKKFSIPEPEEGDEIAKPTYGGGMGGVLPFKSDALLSLKAGADAPIGTQQHIDRLAAAALHKGVGSFKRAFEPVLKMIENADESRTAPRADGGRHSRRRTLRRDGCLRGRGAAAEGYALRRS